MSRHAWLTRGSRPGRPPSDMNQLSRPMPGKRQECALEDTDCRYTQSSVQSKGRIFVFVFDLSSRSRETLTPIYTFPRQRFVAFDLQRVQLFCLSTFRSTKTGFGYSIYTTTTGRSVLVQNTTMCTWCAICCSTRLALCSTRLGHARAVLPVLWKVHQAPS